MRCSADVSREDLIQAACWCDVLEDKKYVKEKHYLGRMQLSLFW